jgi:hypothetical protein
VLSLVESGISSVGEGDSLRLDECFFGLIKVVFTVESRWICGSLPQSSFDVGEEVLRSARYSVQENG